MENIRKILKNLQKKYDTENGRGAENCFEILSFGNFWKNI